MKRFPLLFTTVVWTVVLTLFLVRLGADSDPYDGLGFEPLSGEALAALETPRGPHALTGAIVTEDGLPVADALVELVAIEPPLAASPWATRTDANGRFKIERLPPGRYGAHIVGQERAPVHYETVVPADVVWSLLAPVEPPVMLPPLVGGTLTGAIAPPVGWSVEEHPLAEFEVTFVPSTAADPLSGAQLRRTRTDASGGFRFIELVFGTYDVYVTPPWAHDGDWPRLAEESRRHGASDRAITLRLRSGALDLRVTRSDGAGVPNALVLVSPEADLEQVWPITTTDTEGRASVEHLPPGRYVVRAHAGAHIAESIVEVRIGQRGMLRFDAFDER